MKSGQLIMLYSLLVFSFLILSPDQAMAVNPQLYNKTALGQGVSSPAATSIFNFNKGLTKNNPVAVTYQQNVRLAGQYTTGRDHVNSYGGELGVGEYGRWGGAVASYKDCDQCESRVQGALGLSLDRLAIGFTLEENVTTVGLMLNPYGFHRFGVVVDFNQDQNYSNSFAVGYSYFNSGFSFSLDGSFRSVDLLVRNEDYWMVTPGIGFYYQRFNFTLSYDFHSSRTSWDERDQLWFGVGFGTPGKWLINVYNDYVNRWAFSANYYF